jgi:soluble lytic murein transglycosylase-like protein
MLLSDSQKAAVDSIIAAKSAAYGVDQNVIRAIIQQESDWDINARLWEPTLNVASIGLMQVLTTTASSVAGHVVTEADLFDPNINIDIGTHYLQTLQNQYGSQGLQAVFAAYNAGSPRMTSDGSFVNQGYVDKVMAFYTMYADLGAGAQIAADTYQKMTGGPATGNPSSPIGMLLISGSILLLDAFKVFRSIRKAT